MNNSIFLAWVLYDLTTTYSYNNSLSQLCRCQAKLQPCQTDLSMLPCRLFHGSAKAALAMSGTLAQPT